MSSLLCDQYINVASETKINMVIMEKNRGLYKQLTFCFSYTQFNQRIVYNKTSSCCSSLNSTMNQYTRTLFERSEECEDIQCFSSYKTNGKNSFCENSRKKNWRKR